MAKKNILQFVIFFIFSCMVVLGISSESYAWTYDQFIDYMEQIATNPNAPQDFRDTALSIYNNSETIRNYMGNYKTIYCDTLPGYVSIYGTNNDLNSPSIRNNLIQFGRTYFNQITYEFNSPNTINNLGTTSNTYLNSQYVIGLVELPENIENSIPQAYWLQNKYEQGFEWLPINATKVTIGVYTNVQAKKIGQSDGYVIGKINKFDDRFNYYKVVVFNNQGEKIASCQMKRDQQWFWGNDGMSYYYPTNTFDIKARLIYLKQIYTVVIYASDEQINQANTEAKDSQVYTYIFLPSNAVISNGVITNYGSGDNYTSQDSTNDIIDYLGNTESANNTIDNFLSGDSSSFANSIGYSPITNPFVGIIENTLSSIVNILLGSGNETLTIALRDQPIVLHSENFTIPDGAIKTFITLVTNGFLVWAIIKYGFELYQWINTGRLQNLVNEANGHWYKALF